MKTIFLMYPAYFKLNINQKINERQQRNALNINFLFNTVLTACNYTKYKTTYPQINNGLYHHFGKNHSQYSKN